MATLYAWKSRDPVHRQACVPASCTVRTGARQTLQRSCYTCDTLDQSRVGAPLGPCVLHTSVALTGRLACSRLFNTQVIVENLHEPDLRRVDTWLTSLQGAC